MHRRRILTPASRISTSFIPVYSSSRFKSYVLKFVRGHLPSDLKDVQGAIGCLFGELPDADEYVAFKMPQRHLDTYNQLGYVVMPHPVLSASQVDIVADEADQLNNEVEHHSKSELLYASSLTSLRKSPLFYCQGQWRACWGMHDLALMPHLTVPTSQLLGDVAVRLWYDEVIAKQAKIGPCLPWQQNYQRWQHTGPIGHVTVIVALDNLNKDRGAPCVIPGSHRWRQGELLPPVPFQPDLDEVGQMATIWDLVNEEERECLMDAPPVTLDLKRGQAAFIHPLLVHATHANRTLDWSRTVNIHYMRNGTATVQDGPLLPRTTRFAANTPIGGPFFPVVFDPAIMDDAEAQPNANAPRRLEGASSAP
jgi:hypothetical protein